MRALARQRRKSRIDRAIAARLEFLSRDAGERVGELEAGTAEIARQCAELEEIALGHEAAAHRLASWLWHVAAYSGSPLLRETEVQQTLLHYLPELGSDPVGSDG